MNTRIVLSTIFLATLLVTGCVSTSTLVEERLDLGTGVTVTHSTAPVVLYRDNSAYAAHARDYVYVGPVEINRMGEYSYYLWLGIWSTVSDAERAFQRDGFESITLFADGEPLQLELVGWTLESIGVSEPVYVKPVAGRAARVPRPRTVRGDGAVPAVNRRPGISSFRTSRRRPRSACARRPRGARPAAGQRCARG
jgi:hypothetical protein